MPASGLKDVIWKDGVGNPVHEVTDHGWLFLHAAWYTILAANMLPEKLAQYDFVIMDGWFYKITSRFLAKGSFDGHLVEAVFGHLPKGDVVFYLDASPETCLRRKAGFTDAEVGANEGFEGSLEERFLSYQKGVQAAYGSLATAGAWTRLEASSKDALTLAHEATEIMLADR